MKRFGIVAVAFLCICAGANLGLSIASVQAGATQGRDLVIAAVLAAVALFMAAVVSVMSE